MMENKNFTEWAKPEISLLAVSLTNTNCDSAKLQPGNDGTTDTATGNACGS